MKQKFLLIIIFLIPISVLNATEKLKQDTLWKKGGETALSFSQIGLTNWASGGEDALSATIFLNYFANYKNENFIWENKFEFAYGLQKQEGQELRKSDDKIYISTTLGRKASKKWYYTSFFSFKSQFANGYNYPDNQNPISKFFAPAYIVLSIGMEYKPNSHLSINFAPVAGRMTIVSNQILSDSGAFGVTPGKKTRSEFGANIILNYRQELIKNIEFKTKLELYSNYSNHPENIDIDWEMFFNLKVNKYISANITTHLIYDKDILIKNDLGELDSRVQFKEVFGLGIIYKF